MNPSAETEWYLEGFLGQGRTWSIPVDPLPFTIGRQESSSLHLTSSEVSRQHAEIFSERDTLWIKDLGSTNGTFRNHQRIERQVPLASKDILHFGSLEFRLTCREHQVESICDPMETGIFTAPPELPDQFVQCAGEFEQLLVERQVIPLYQPIVSTATGRIVGCELLGRGRHPDLPEEPRKLLHIAERLGREVELSQLFRETGILGAGNLPDGVQLFMNEHPSELEHPERMVAALKCSRELAPDLPMVLEVNEKTVTDLRAIRELRSALSDLEIGLAYDDFGAGQARLLELIEVPPDYLKFDAFLIRDLHRQTERFHRALRSLIEMSRDLGVVPLAEGVETEGELAACKALGFEAIQGYFFGRPAPLPPLTSTAAGPSDQGVGVTGAASDLESQP